MLPTQRFSSEGVSPDPSGLTRSLSGESVPLYPSSKSHSKIPKQKLAVSGPAIAGGKGGINTFTCEIVVFHSTMFTIEKLAI